MKGFILGTVVLCGLELCSAGLADVRTSSQTYHWPLDAEPILTSTFCEYRTAHFHSGIDLGTMRRVGLDVFAVESGYVWRVKTSPWGSGKALYVKLTDGRIAVYFHLSGFAPAIERFVAQEQEKIGHYSIDVFPGPQELPVNRGEVIGYSGDTGVGGPHFHFEIRDEDNSPLNPLLNGFAVVDTISPLITGLSLTPLDREAMVEGKHEPAVVAVHEVEPDHVEAEGSVAVWGSVGIAVRAVDLADSAVHKLSVYRTDLYVDDHLIFRRQYDRFPFELTRQIDLDRDFSLIKSGQGRFERLYVAEGNTMPFYSENALQTAVHVAPSLESGWCSIPGVHRLRVVVADAQGNEAEADLSVLVNRPPVIWEFSGEAEQGRVRVKAVVGDSDDEIRLVRFEHSTDGGATWSLSAVDSLATPLGTSVGWFPWDESLPLLCRVRALDASGEWSAPEFWMAPTSDQSKDGKRPRFHCDPTFHPTFVEWDICADLAFDRAPQITVVQLGGASHALELARVDHKCFHSIYAFPPDLDGRAVLRFEVSDSPSAGEAQAVTFDVFAVSAGKGGAVASEDGLAAAYFEEGQVYSTFWARCEEGAQKQTDVLVSRSKAYEFDPQDVPFAGPASISLKYAGGPERVGVYRREAGGWKFVGARIDTLNHCITAPAYSFGTFALLEDTLGPRVWRLRPADGSAIGGSKVPLSASIRDGESGIGREEDITMELDGRRVISAYDPEAGSLKCRVKSRLSAGSHVLTVAVTDMAGNRTVKSSRFTVAK